MANAPLGNMQTVASGDAQQQYLDTMNQLMEALENRAQPNLFQVAGALAKPTRTGNALEALGEGASEYGRQVAEQEKLQPSLIQMKAGLAEKQLELRNKSDAMNMFGRALGVAPDEAMGVLASGNLQDNQLNGLLKSFPLIASKDAKVGSMLKDYIGMNVDQEKLIVEQKKLKNEAELFKDKTGNWPQWYQPDIFTIAPKAPIGQTTEKPVVEKTSNIQGQDLFNTVKQTAFNKLKALGVKNPEVASQIVATQAMLESGGRNNAHNNLFGIKAPGDKGMIELPTKEYVNGQYVDTKAKFGANSGIDASIDQYINMVKKNPKYMEALNAPDVKTGFNLLSTSGYATAKPEDYSKGLLNNFNKFNKPQDVLVASTDKYVGLSPQQIREQQAKDIESQRAIAEEEAKANINLGKTTQTEAMKEPQKLVDAITQKGNYGVVSNSNTQLTHLENLIKKNKDVMDIMYDKGVLSSLGVAAEKGVQTPWGSLSLPAYDAMIAGLPKEKVAAAKEIAQIIYEQNQSIMKAGKDIYGPQISNSDATQMAKVGFQPSDPSKYILTLSQKMRLVNTWNNKISNVYDDWVENNPKASPRQFFKSDDYKITVDNFNKTYSTFLKGLQ